MKTFRKYISVFCFFLIGLLVAEEAIAQYYGTNRRVARRTARRTSRRTSARYNAYYGGVGYGAATVVTTLPGGCVLRTITGINYQYCDGVYYRPYYEGTELVYVVENP